MKKATIILATGETMQASLAKADLVVITFSRKEVESGLVGDAVDRLLQLSDSTAHVHQFANSVVFQFEGYDADPREVHQIRECVAFMRLLYASWPYWLHFLDKDSPCIMTLLFLLCDVELCSVGSANVGVRIRNLEQFGTVVKELFNAMNGLHELHGIGQAVNDAMSAAVLRTLDVSLGAQG